MQNPNKPIWFGEESIVETIDLSDPKPESKSISLFGLMKILIKLFNSLPLKLKL